MGERGPGSFCLKPYVLIGFMTLLAFALRVYHIDALSFWYDEAFAAFYAREGLAALFRDVPAENHPPFYFLALQLWQIIAGPSEFSLRYLSLLFGVLTVPLCAKIASRLMPTEGITVGTVAALFLAASPLHVWHSQEARMYTLVALLGMLSLHFLLNALQDKARKSWLVYVLFSALGAFTHFYFIFFIAAEAVFVAGLFIIQPKAKRSELAARWVGAQLGIGVFLLPLAYRAMSVFETNKTYWTGPLDLGVMGRQVAFSFAGGPTLVEEAAAGYAAYWVGLFSLGVIVARIKQTDDWFSGLIRSLFLFVIVFIPLLLLAIISFNTPKATPRYIMFVLPVFYISGAIGIVGLATFSVAGLKRLWIAKVTGILVAGLLVAPIFFFFLQSLGNLYFDDRFAKDDFRGLVRYVESQAVSGDSVVIVGGHAEVAYNYYQKTAIPVYPIPRSHLPNIDNPVGPEIVSLLNEISMEHRRVWLIRWQSEVADPANHVLQQFSVNAQRKTIETKFSGLDLYLFTLIPERTFKAEPEIQWKVGRDLDYGLELLGFDVDKLWVLPGDSIGITLYWRTKDRLNDDLTAFIHLLDSQERVIGQIDKRPVNDYYTTQRWPVGRIARDEYYLKVPPGTAAGRYILEAGIYRTLDGTRLEFLDNGEDRIILLQPDVGVLPQTSSY